MTENSGDTIEASPDLSARSSMATGGNVTRGDQTVAWAETKIRMDTAAHEREIEKQRVAREIKRDEDEQAELLEDRKHQRWRDNITYLCTVLLIVGGLIWSFSVATSTADPVRQAWAQGLVTTIAGALAGAFAGYMVANRK